MDSNFVDERILTDFRPKNVQFVLYDVNVSPDDAEDALWAHDNEQEQLSSRTAELAIGLFDNESVDIKTTFHDQTPDRPDGL